MAVRLVYETHATTVDNEAGVCTGWAPGVLSERGRQEAVELGERRPDVDLVVSSDLARAVETVELAFAGRVVERRTDERLREVDFGDLTGAPHDVVLPRRAAHVHEPFPGGESYDQVAQRVGALLDDLARELDGRTVLLVGHAAPRYALDHLLTGRPLARAVVAPPPWRPGWTYRLTLARPVAQVLDGPAALAVADELAAVYRAAFGPPPYSESEERLQGFAEKQLPVHAARERFRCSTVRLDGRLAGFGYAYTGRRGEWFTDTVAEAVGPRLAEQWLDGHLEVVELAVDPAVRSAGLGAALTDLLVDEAPHSRALLATWHGDDRPAARLYRRLGWERLHEQVFPGFDLWGLRLR
jgi:broad specificity phosphatase PhoE/ribosomal protein S18 acetylase RimI-like enzyme